MALGIVNTKHNLNKPIIAKSPNHPKLIVFREEFISGWRNYHGKAIPDKWWNSPLTSFLQSRSTIKGLENYEANKKGCGNRL